MTVKNNKERGINMNIRNIFATMLPLLLIASSAQATNWEMIIKATTASNAVNKLSLGQKDNATDGFDGRYEVPAYVEGNISAYFPHDDWSEEASKYWRDIKGTGEEKSWDIRVESPQTDDVITLSWKSATIVDGINITLTDNATGESVDMTAAQSYSYTNSGPRGFTVNSAGLAERGKPARPAASFQRFDSGSDANLPLGGSVDAGGNTITYRAEVYSDRNLTSLVASAGEISAEGQDVSWNIGSLPDGVYYYRVESHNGYDYSGWSNTRALRVGSASDARSDKALGGKRF